MNGLRFANGIILGASGWFAFFIVYTAVTHLSLYYTLVSAVIFGLLVFSFRLSTPHKINLALVIVSSGFTLVMAEIALEVKGFTTDRDGARAAAAFWLDEDSGYDPRSMYDVISDLKKDGIDAYPLGTTGTLGPLGFEEDGVEIFPFGGISQRVTVLCNETGEYSIYQSDEHGFNNPLGIWDQAPLDVVAVGDSFTHGMCAEPELNFSAGIRSTHPKTLNLGLTGTGPATHLAIIKEYLGELKPKRVLWFFYEGNDLGDLQPALDLHPKLTRYLNDPSYRQNLVNKQPAIDQHLTIEFDRRLAKGEGLLWTKSNEQRVDFIRNALAVTWGDSVKAILKLRNLRSVLFGFLDSIRGIDNGVNDESLARLSDMLAASTDYVSSWGGQLYFVYLPSWQRYHLGSNKNRQPEIKAHHDVISISERLGIPVIDISNAFDLHPDPLSLWPFRFEGHYNADGHKVVADTVIASFSLQK